MGTIDFDRYWSPAFEDLDDLVFLVDSDNNIVKTNRYFARFTKRSKNELIGKKYCSIVYETIEPPPECPHLRVSKSKVLERTEFFDPKSQKWFSVCSIPIFDPGQHLVAALHIAHNITDWKKRERGMEVKIEALDKSVGAIAIGDTEGKLTYVNPSCLKLWGYKSESEVYGRSTIEFYEEKEKIYEVMRAFSKGRSWFGEILARKKDGTIFNTYVSTNVIKDKNGNAICITASIADITRIREGENALKEAEEKYRTLVESAQEGIGVVDPEENIIFVNEAFAKILGYKVNELTGKNLKGLTSKEEFGKYRKETEKRKMGGKNRYETVLYHKNGQHRCLSVSAAPLWNQDRSFKGTLGVVMDITNQKKAEEEIREAKEFTENIISSMVDALIVLDPKGKIQTVNGSLCELLDYGEKDLIGQPFGMLIAEEEEVPIIDKRFRKLLRRGPVIGYTVSFATKTAEKVPVSVYGSVMRDEKEKLVGVVLTARDMRERIAAENKIKESEERYRGVVENLTDAIFLLDEQGKFVHMNRPGIKLYGWKKLSDIIKRNFVEDAHRKYFGVLAKAVETAWSGKMAECHYESTTKGGLHKWWEVTLVPLRDASGKILNIVGISRDVTLKKQSEQLIKFYKEYAEHIVANLPISILILNREIEINFANQHFIKRLGKSREEVIDKPLEEILGKAFKGFGFDEKIRAVIRGDDTMPRGRFELRGKHYDYQVLRFKERIGRRYNAMLIMEDITDRIHLEEQIRDAEKMSAIGQFTAGIAHEINNPLGIVLANIQYLTSNMDKIDFTDKKQVNDLNEVLETIGEQSRRCGEIVSNLLHFTHRGRGEEESVNIDKVVRRTMQMMEHQLRLSKVESVVDLDGNLPVIKGDINRLQQVFVNLILNAQHAMMNGGKLHIKTFAEDNWVCISFRDTGPGIPKKHQKRIFEPFYTTRKAGEGTGLGLSVVRSIIQEHRGTISVDSKRGAGATFKITLPIAKKGLFGLWK